MATQLSTLSLQEVQAARAATRLVRYLTVVGVAVAVPLLVVLATPLMGWMLLAAILLSPLLVGYVLLVAAQQAERERRAS